MTRADSGVGRFATTRWSLVAALADQDQAVARASLVTLCLRYWYPVHAYLRRSGHEPAAARALTLRFFHQLLGVDMAHTTARRHGRFRQFLLAELHRFLADAAPAASTAVAKDDDLAPPPLEALEARLEADGATALSPEQQLQRGFALEMLAAAKAQLRREAEDAGRLPMFESLQHFLGVEARAGDYEAVARGLGLRPMFVAVAVQRLRQRFRELVDRELVETLTSPDELEAERQALMQVLDARGA